MDHDTKAFVARFEAWPSLKDEAEDAGWKLTLTKDRRYAVLVQGGMGIKSNERITRKCSTMVVRGRGKGGGGGITTTSHKSVAANPTLRLRVRDRYHRWLVRDVLGTARVTGCHVHHHNGDTGDNCIENLRVMSQREHLKRHASDGAGLQKRRRR